MRNVTCSAVNSGSSLMHETMIECISICSLSSSSSDRSRDWLSNFCPPRRAGRAEIEKQKDDLDETTNRWLSRLTIKEQIVYIGVSAALQESNVANSVQGTVCLNHYTTPTTLPVCACVRVCRTSCSMRLRVGRCRERVCDVFQSTGITLP